MKKLTKIFTDLKNLINKSDLIIARRVFLVGIINTLVGPSILFLLDFFLNNLVKSYFLMQLFMFFFKTLLYKKIVFKEIKSKKSFLIPIILVLWGFILANFIQSLLIDQIYKVFILVFALTFSNSCIAIFGARLIKDKIKGIE